MKWDAVEGTRDSFDFAAADRIVDHARARGMKVRGRYNDYNNDGVNAKSTAVYTMVKDFKARGVPIDCVGFQGHFNADSPVPADLAANLQRFADLGVEVQITELDIEGSGSAQATGYANVVKACLAVTRCSGSTVWGITDKYSWRAGGTPLLFDSSYARKPAYDAVVSAFGATPDPGDPGTRTCTATYGRTADWQSGYNGQVTVRAGGAALSGWTVTLTLPPGQQLASTWNGVATTSGQTVTVRPVAWNSSVAAGASTGFGFTVNKNGGNADPVVGSCTAS